MRHTSRNGFRYALRCLCIAALTCSAVSINAQTDLEPKLQEFVLKAYTAYQQKDQQTLFSLHSESSPYFAEFKETILNDFSHRQNVRSERKLIRAIKADVQADKAILRLVVNMDF